MKFIDRKRKNVLYEIKNMIFFSTKNINIIRSFKKLNHKMIKSFRVIKETEDSYKLQLLKLIKRKYLIFYPSLLRKIINDPLFGQID